MPFLPLILIFLGAIIVILLIKLKEGEKVTSGDIFIAGCFGALIGTMLASIILIITHVISYCVDSHIPYQFKEYPIIMQNENICIKDEITYSDTTGKIHIQDIDTNDSFTSIKYDLNTNFPTLRINYHKQINNKICDILFGNLIKYQTYEIILPYEKLP